ncbi:MAG: RusA family crossover junction endodeoxyribonuclease [Betaproteobacteria bacterium]|nr:RusA family crossover junction endodeoxyribonuclease [Betaproteobacteria bacterium]
MKLSFTVPGNPCGKGRPRFARKGNHMTAYTDDKEI